MEISFLGQSSFKIKTKKVTIVTDPYDPLIGIKMPKVSADIITVSHQHHDHNFIEAVSGTPDRPQPFIAAGPGEYEISDVFIRGIASYHDVNKKAKNTVYLIMTDGLELCHLGDLGRDLTEKQLEIVNQVDVLFIPAGGVYTITPEKAAQVVNQIEPKIVIPMHYQLPGLNLNLAPVDKFLAELGTGRKKEEDKLTIRADLLPEGERQVIVLKKRN